MSDIYKYSILKEIGLIVTWHQNEISSKGLKKMKIEIANDLDFNVDFVFLFDIRGTQIQMTNDELLQHELFISSDPRLNKISKLAILVNNPQHTAKSIIYKLNANDRINKYDVFSTIDAALNWLNIDSSKIGLVENKIKELSQ